MRGGDDLWAKAAELERQFEGYKRRVAERRASASDRPDVDAGDGGAEEEVAVAVAVAVGRGRRYDAYVRRRDEKLRQGWRARMERKEAEMKELWARLDDRRRDGDLAAGRPDKEQKPGNVEVKPAASPATPRSSSAVKTNLSRHRTTPRTSTPSPASAAASPRLSSNPDARRRAPHREPSQAEPPSTPRKENRVPSTAAAAVAATMTPRLRALSRSRSSLKEPDRASTVTVRDSPRRPPPPPRFQSPRPSHDGAAGDRPKQPVLAPTTADAVAPAAQSCQRQQVVLAEIKTAPAFCLRRSGNGAGQGQPAASPRPVITRQVDGRLRPSDIGKMNNVQISRNSDVEAKNFNLDEGINEDDTAQCSVELGSLKITGDSDTEPSYVYIKKDIEEEAMNSSQPQPLAASGSNAEEPEAPEPHQSEKETGDLEETTRATSSEATAKESPATDQDQEDASPQSSDQSFYSNVDSSFSHRSELAASPTDSPLHGSPSSTCPSTEQLLEADAAMLRKKREEEEEDDAAAGEINSLLITSTTTTSSSVACPVAVHAQSPMEAVAGLKRFLTFGKKNISIKTGADAAAVAPPADDDGVGHGWASGDSGVRQRICSSDAASDDSDNSYVIPTHVRSLQSCVPCSPAKPVLLKELISSAKSPRAHRSFFSFSSFKSRGY